MSSYILLSNVIGVIAAIVFAFLWGGISDLLSHDSVDLTPLALACVCISVYASGWSVLTSEALMLDGRAANFAGVSVSRDLFGALVALGALYLLDLGLQSLFLGLAASALVDVFWGVRTLYPYMGSAISWRCVGSILSEIHLTAVQILDSGARAFERVLISRNIGLPMLGIISHSQTYETVSMAFIKSLVRSIWPENLKEAKDPASKFPAARIATEVMAVASLCGAILLGTIGFDIVGLLTHGKFNHAAYFAAVWVANIALTATSLAPKAVAVASGRAYLMSIGPVAGRVVSLAALLLLMGWLQEAAVAIAAILAAITLKVVLYVGVLRFRKVPFQDGRAILCVMGAYAVILISIFGAHDLRSRVLLFLAAGLLVVFLNRNVMRMLLQRLSFA